MAIRKIAMALAFVGLAAPASAQVTGGELTLLQPGLSGGVVVTSTGLAVAGGFFVIAIVGGLGGDSTQSTQSTTGTTN